jgi:RNA polymerase sigma factor (sigma-70 family)
VTHFGLADRPVTKLHCLMLDAVDSEADETRADGHHRSTLDTAGDFGAGPVAHAVIAISHHDVQAGFARYRQHRATRAQGNLADLVENESSGRERRDPARQHHRPELVDAFALVHVERSVRSWAGLPEEREPLEQPRIDVELLFGGAIHASSLRHRPALAPARRWPAAPNVPDARTDSPGVGQSGHNQRWKRYSVVMMPTKDRARWSDGQLLAAIAACDDRAFSVFYRRHLALVVGWCVRRTGDPELAADLTAEVFAAVLSSADRYEPQGDSAIGWLVGIARNVLGHSVRRGQIDARARERIGASSLALGDEDLAVVWELADSIDRGADPLLAELPVDERTAVHARVIEERDYREIAGSLGCSEMVVRKRVSRGLARLRSRLATQ